MIVIFVRLSFLSFYARAVVRIGHVERKDDKFLRRNNTCVLLPLDDRGIEFSYVLTRLSSRFVLPRFSRSPRGKFTSRNAVAINYAARDATIGTSKEAGC